MIPVMVKPGNARGTPVYRYIRVSVAVEKVVIQHLVYCTKGSVVAGGE